MKLYEKKNKNDGKLKEIIGKSNKSCLQFSDNTSAAKWNNVPEQPVTP